jgi:hypothetical protein
MQENFIDNLLKKPIWVAFLISWLFYLAGLFLFSQMVWDATTYQSDFTGNDFDSVLSGYRRVDMVRYALSPMWILAVAVVIWALLKFGLTISQTEIKAALLFKVILLSLLFISLPYWVKSVWFVLLKSGYTPDEIKHFFPGSIIPFLDVSGMSETQIKALANINLYHLGFILFSAWAITKNSVLSYFKSFLLVLLTYGTCIALINFFRVFFLS